jgi:peptide deformylase
MPIRPIVSYPGKVLHQRAEPVTRFDQELVRLLEDMAETMYSAQGVGLAAPQIGVSQRIFVIDVAAGDDAPSDFRVFINPEILERTGSVSFSEGCLSLPGLREELGRAEHVRVRAQDARGEPFELAADGLLAIAIQHEDDHINGKLIIDHLSPLRKRLAHRAIIKGAK